MAENIKIEQHEKEYRDIGIVIMVEEEAKEEAERLVRLISEQVDLVSMVDRDHPAHISLFQGRLPGKFNADYLRQQISNLQEPGTIEIPMAEELFIRPNGNVFWNAKPNDNLSRLHLKLVEELQTLTGDLLMKQFQDILDNPRTSADDREQILKYGSLLAGPKFLPHITLARLKELTDQEKIRSIRPNPMTIRLNNRLVITELNPDGSLYKK
jgi:2'-5' RNA ligase